MEENEEKILENEEKIPENKNVCPICGSENLVINGRCTTCYSCGYSLCSM